MNKYWDKSEQEIAMEFFKAPTGTVLCERGAYFQSAIYAVKLPLGQEKRFSMVLAERLSKNNFDEHGAYPARDWKLTLDSYVDNETGSRVICDVCSEFAQILDYREGILIDRAYAEIEDAIRGQILSAPEDVLCQAARKAGRVVETAAEIKHWERSQIQAECERAFVFDAKPDLNTNLRKDLGIERLVPSPAQFAISYLKDKNQLIQGLTAQLILKYATEVIHYRMMQKEMERYMEEIAQNPNPLLLKERNIRRAVRGKASVWVTFSNGDQTLRIFIPTAIFHTTGHELNKFPLPDKDGKKLQAFLKQQGTSCIGPICMEQIVALDYRGRVLYQDKDFYKMRGG